MGGKRLLVIGGGGTGGHIFVGISIGKMWLERGGDVLFIGSSHGMEGKIVKEFPLRLLKVGPVRGKGIRGFISAALEVPLSIMKVLFLFLRERPSVVLGIGGYASFPVCFSAWLMGIPFAIVEQNTVPGLANRVLSRLSRIAFTGFKTTGSYLRAREIIHTGNPVRKEIKEFSFPPLEARRDYPTVLVLGGSQGASFLNRTMPEVMRRVRDSGIDARIIHQAGREKAETERMYRQLGLRAEVFDFTFQIHLYLARAHLAVCRAGALTISELACAGVPAVFIPYPYGAGGHQLFNAMEVESAGGGICLEQKEASPERLSEVLTSLLKDRKRLEEMSVRVKGLFSPDADRVITDRLWRFVRC